jgi:hypothetical protein
MRVISWQPWLTLCFMLAATPWAGAQGTVDLSSPKKATTAFAIALQSGDLDQVKASSIGDDSDYKLMETVTSTMTALRRLQDAAVTRFGPEDAKKLGAGVNNNTQITRQVEGADEKVDGDSATILESGKPLTDVIHLKKVNGNWKVDLTNYPQKQIIKQNAPMLDATRSVITQSALDVAAGHYKNVDEASLDLQRRTNIVQAAVLRQRPPQTNPAK